MNTTNYIISNLPFTALKPISNGTADPTFQRIRTVCTKLNINAAYVFISLGGGLHGHLAITITSDKYTDTTATTSFVVPVNSATAPVQSSTSTTEKIDETIHLYSENRRAFQLYHYVDKALWNQLISDKPRTFLQ